MQAVIKNITDWVTSTNRNLYSHGSRCYKFKIKMPAISVPSERFSSWLVDSCILLCPHLVEVGWGQEVSLIAYFSRILIIPFLEPYHYDLILPLSFLYRIYLQAVILGVGALSHEFGAGIQFDLQQKYWKNSENKNLNLYKPTPT